jgi:hypothetical protein
MQQPLSHATYTVLRLENHDGGHRCLRDLLFTEAQWERFLGLLPGLAGFIGFTPVIDGPVATFTIDMDQPGLPNPNSRTLEIVHQAVLAYWTEEGALSTPGIAGIDIGGEGWYVNDTVASKIRTYLRISDAKEWTHFLGASGWADVFISDHAKEFVRKDEKLLVFLRQRSDAIHETIYGSLDYPDRVVPHGEYYYPGVGYPEGIQVIDSAPLLEHSLAESREYRSIFEYLKAVEADHPPNIFKLILLNGLGLPTIHPRSTPHFRVEMPYIRSPEEYEKYLAVWHTYAAEHSRLDLATMVRASLSAIYGASVKDGVRGSWEFGLSHLAWEDDVESTYPYPPTFPLKTGQPLGI